MEYIMSCFNVICEYSLKVFSSPYRELSAGPLLAPPSLRGRAGMTPADAMRPAEWCRGSSRTGRPTSARYARS